jgi:thiol-disulfide isomerase/thioredoxin
MNEPRLRLAAGLAVLALAVAACGDGRVQPRAGEASEAVVDGAVLTLVPADARDPAPDFSGELLSGEGEYRLADSRGEVVVINVWGSWCAPCRAEAPVLQSVYEQTRADGVAFVGVNTRDNRTAAQTFEAEYDITYPSVFDPSGTSLLAFRDTVPPAAIPSTVVIDRRGSVAARLIGEVSERSLLAVVDEVSGEEPAREDG